MKYVYTILLLCSLTFIAGCTSAKQETSSETSIDKQRIQQLEKNDNYIPWWKR